VRDIGAPHFDGPGRSAFVASTNAGLEVEMLAKVGLMLVVAVAPTTQAGGIQWLSDHVRSWAWSPHGVWDSHVPELFPGVRFSTMPVGPLQGKR
jgi:hypothetical protein